MAPTLTGARANLWHHRHDMPSSLATAVLLDWFAASRRDLPWRRPGTGAWGVLVSEVMLQQTPVQRVLPAYAAWMCRWPLPAALAGDPAGEAVRMWARLGYPRRALRLHTTAELIDEEHEGAVPSTYAALRRLPGVGDYTAAAVLAFAYRQRTVVLDTNVRRVLTRVFGGRQFPSAAVSRPERQLAEAVLPADPETAATWNAAAMELGALVCTTRSPRCDQCPLSRMCAWRLAGYPAYDGPPRRVQTYLGSDRQCRGRILSVLRDREEPVPAHDIELAWTDAVQREHALSSLLCDGLVVRVDEGALALP
ncbi:MAG: A/G-specific adenine glycosylase [Nocardioidaceae bacterium]